MSQEKTRRRKRRPVHIPDPTPTKPPIEPGLVGGQYKPLSDQDIQKIHNASLDVLEQIGIEVMPSECRDIFAKAGAIIDESRNRVFIPRAMVEDALSIARNEVVLYGRDDPRHDMYLSGAKVYMGTGGAAVKILDLETQAVRETVLDDIAKIGWMCDALDNIHFYLRPCVARDLTNEQLDINTFYAAITNTTKHVTGNCFTVESFREVFDMCAMIAGSAEALKAKPFISVTSCWTVSPLRYAAETIEVMTDIVRHDIPVFLSSAPQAGATSPAALAGSLVQINAEELSGLVYTQLLKPGAPVILGYVPSVADLRTGNFIGGAAEFALMNAAICQLGQFYKIPVYNSSGLSDSKLPDIQAGYEKGITGLAVALAGANYVHHSAGFLESLLTIAYEQYIIDNDINGSIMRAVRGIEVNDETLSVDVIRDVCFGEGHYLGTQQSLGLMHSEYFYPPATDRRNREDWEMDGALDMRERARIQARELMKTHQPKRIDPAVDAAIRQKFDIVLDPKLAGIG